MKSVALMMLLVLGLFSGCTTYRIDSEDTTLNYYPPKNSPDDVVYMETVDKPFEQIGIVTVTTERRQTLEDALPKLKYEASILGGDVITDIQVNSTGVWQNVKVQKYLGHNGYVHTQYSAKVLVLK